MLTKQRKLAYEILGLIGVSAFFAAFLLLILIGTGGAIVQGYCFRNNIVMTEFDWLEADRWIWSVSGVLTFVDLLIIVSMVLIAASFLSVVLMLLIRKQRVQRVCFYIATALSLYIGYVGIRINWMGFEAQAILTAVMALVSVASLVLALVKKNDDKVFLYARIANAVALVAGAVNALLI